MGERKYKKPRQPLTDEAFAFRHQTIESYLETPATL
jgi:hypothetical protein